LSGGVVLIDTYRLVHWMNLRKVTPEQVTAQAGFDEALLRAATESGRFEASSDIGARLGEVLRVSVEQLTADEQWPAVVVMTAEEVAATRRPIRRGGLHFYNYYTMAHPPGEVGPVILDILCPPTMLPELNSGHLEPAITLNLGPGDIHGRWGTELTPDTWHELRANRSSDSWIVGDSYVEPSYCPHAYALASDRPARIISYTASSALAPLLDDFNRWSDAAFANAVERIGDASGAAALAEMLDRRGYAPSEAASAVGLEPQGLERFLGGDPTALTVDDLRRLGTELGFDHRLCLPVPWRGDLVGKTYMSFERSRSSVRRFRGYEVASIATAPQLPDLTGLFMKIERPGGGDDLALSLLAESHYYVVSGPVSLSWEQDGAVARRALDAGSTAWVAPGVRHGFGGRGAVVALASGRHVNAADWLTLSTTYAVSATLRRSRRDLSGWGYDVKGQG
jgi:hypothetical protein